MKLSVIIPVFNEAPTLAAIIQQVATSPLPSEIAKEIIVVNDGSSDNSRAILDQLKDSFDLKVFHHNVNQGKTAAIRRGLEEATGDFILIQDADLEYSPKDFPALLEPLLTYKAKIVYGSRFKGQITGMTLTNRIANRTSNITFNILFGTHLTDINTCYKVLPQQIFKKIPITSSHFVFETEITARLIHNGYEILEVPIHYQGRSVKRGKKMNWLRALQMFWGILRFRFSENFK
jgi:glycosyltransferase involved in cell wall biosynthesis